MKADLAVCESRDPKGHCKQLRAEGIPDFNGLSASYEEAAHPELGNDTTNNNIDQCIAQLMNYVTGKLTLNEN